MYKHITARSPQDALTIAIEEVYNDGLNPEVNICYFRVEDEFGNPITEHYLNNLEIREMKTLPDGTVIEIGHHEIRRKKDE